MIKDTNYPGDVFAPFLHLPTRTTLAGLQDLDTALKSEPRMQSTFLPTFKTLDSNSFPGARVLQNNL